MVETGLPGQAKVIAGGSLPKTMVGPVEFLCPGEENSAPECGERLFYEVVFAHGDSSGEEKQITVKRGANGGFAGLEAVGYGWKIGLASVGA